MAQSRFFLLDQPISATEAKSFLCRVVVSTTSPLTQFAPFSLPGTPSHNTNDIIPSILPEPSLSTSIKAFRKAARERGVSVKLANLVGFDITRNEEQSRTLESESVKRYVLPNPDHYFEELMKNEHYSRDVRALLEKVWPRHAYLVTGFLTTTKSAWKIDGSQNSKNALNVTVPVSTLLPAAVAGTGAVDINGGLGGLGSSQQSDVRAVAEEEIFAVSYSVARLSYKPSASKTLFTSNPTVGPPKRAKAHHLAFGNDEEEEEEEIDWDSDDAVEQFQAGSVKRNQSIDADVIISGIEIDELLLNTGDIDMLDVYE
ncbi:hypothetical protein NA56DRAFT_646518 [Hyaloscypha hepaticicola]|uniref:Uncharacterized protein n=1 Tax=Hyaloscypha hepaticicola TaxID=2082293 RepID=A0A2J6Q2A0_9HELO|nr:hypothetical protein NA56DRAFT_646518 [Hyaloscypha hepaticicola]